MSTKIQKAADDDSFACLVRWVEESGGKIAPLFLHRDTTGARGLYAAARITAGDTLLHVPRRCLLLSESARNSSMGRQIAAGLEPVSSHTYLAAYLLQERHARSSPFRPYLELLPTSYSHIPLLFEEHELSLLHGSFTLSLIHEKKEALAREYERLARSVPDLRALGYETFVWARLSVVTRVFSMTMDGRKTHGLVPMADLLNHKWPRETSWGCQDSADSFVVTALQDFAPGDAVHDSYGVKCNGRFFVNYGFALRHNDENTARIVFDTPEGDQEFMVPDRYKAQGTQQMFSCLRLWCAGGGIEYGLGPFSLSNEEKALQLLAAACKRALGAFETTLDEDEALLANPALSANARSCIIMRSGEKRVLTAFLELTQVSLPLLKKTRNELRQVEVEGGHVGRNLIDTYVRAVVLQLVR